MFRSLNKLFTKDISEIDQAKAYPDIEESFWKIHELSKPYTMTSVERLYALYKAVSYIEAAKIDGDIVECGVWKGGSTMCALLTLNEKNNNSRNAYLYDTFEGMSEPGEKDKDYTG